MVFQFPYLYDFNTKLCRKQTTVILNHENVNIHTTSQGEPVIESIKGSNLVVVRHMID
jgi:hypothetical protein